MKIIAQKEEKTEKKYDETFPIIKVKQPIGEFYLASIPARLLLDVTIIKQRGRDKDGVQRDDSDKRATEIALYATDPDATFPTPIIVSCDDAKVVISDATISFNKETIGEIIDGQHRILGLKKADPKRLDDFDLPVVFMTKLDTFDKAYVFSSINSKQRGVPKSLIYDLFDLTDLKSPYRTCHEIAKALNADTDGPFYSGLKMLGKRTSEMEYLTQGSFVTSLLNRISKTPQTDEIAIKKGESLKDDPKLPFRYYWINDEDHLILKILENYFGAIQEVFKEEWNHPTASEYVLRKTVGFVALMGAFDQVWIESAKVGRADKEFFLFFAEKFRENLNGRPLITQEFQSSGSTAGALRKILLGSEPIKYRP